MKESNTKENSSKSQSKSDTDSIWLINSGLNLRRIVGALGMMLPVLVWLWLFVYKGEVNPLPSISHYYYTTSSGIFSTILALIAIFLIVYKYDNNNKDFIASIIAGIFALCVLLFPTNNLSSKIGYEDSTIIITHLKENTLREGFHLISAAIFLISLAYMLLNLFTINKSHTREKHKRNFIYKLCGSVMILAMLIIFSRFACEKLDIIPLWTNFYDKYKLTFWMEALAIESFGFSWLIKGETLFKDKD